MKIKISKIFFFVFSTFFFFNCGNQNTYESASPQTAPTPIEIIASDTAQQKTISKLAFGSCAHQDSPLPIFDVIVKHNPDLFIFLGDNIYGDTEDMKVLKSKYDQLAAKPSFQNLKNNVDIIATWDDHDFGWNDAGRHYSMKKESKEIFI